MKWPSMMMIVLMTMILKILELLIKKKQSEFFERLLFIQYLNIRYFRFGIRDALEANTPVGLLSCDYNKFNRILVSGFSNGSFLLHELPDFNLIHSLK